MPEVASGSSGERVCMLVLQICLVVVAIAMWLNKPPAEDGRSYEPDLGVAEVEEDAPVACASGSKGELASVREESDEENSCSPSRDNSPPLLSNKKND